MTNYRLTTPSDSYSYESGTDSSLIQAFSIAFRYELTPMLQFSTTDIADVAREAMEIVMNLYLAKKCMTESVQYHLK